MKKSNEKCSVSHKKTSLPKPARFNLFCLVLSFYRKSVFGRRGKHLTRAKDRIGEMRMVDAIRHSLRFKAKKRLLFLRHTALERTGRVAEKISRIHLN